MPTNKLDLMTPEQTTGMSNDIPAVSTLDSYKEEAESKKNKKVDELTNELSQVMLESGESLKQKFNFGGFFDSLEKLGNIPLPDKLDSLFKSFINSQLEKFKQAASESAAAAWRGLKNMAKSQVKKLLDVAISRIYMPDVTYLAGIIPLYNMGANLRFGNDYARTKAIKADYNITLQWIDTTIGFTYSIISNKSNTIANLRTAAKGSCVNVLDYMLEFLLAENKSVQRNIKSYQYQIDLKNKDVKSSEKLIEQYQNEIGNQDTTAERREVLEGLITVEKNSIKKYEDSIKQIQIEKDPWDEYDHAYKSALAEAFKCILVYGVGNFNQKKVESMFSKYNIKPAWFGDTDPDFNGKYKFTSSDVDIMAPFYKESGFIKDVQRDLGDTRLVQTSKLPKYITLRNVYLKYIYIQIASVNIYGYGNQLASKVLYERLKYQTMDDLTKISDKFLGTMIEDGLGKMTIDTLLAIERSIYDYTRTVEKAFNDPLSRDYYQLMSYGQELPPPIIPNKPGENNSGGSSNSNGNTNKPIKPSRPENIINNDLTSKELEMILRYYLKYIDKSYYPNLLAGIYTDLKSKYDSTSDKEKSFYKEFIIYHFGEGSLEHDFNALEFFKPVSSEYLINVYISIFTDIYFENYKKIIITDNYNAIDKFLYEEIFLKHYKILKETFYDYQIDQLSDSTVYQHLVFIYTTLSNKALSDSKYTVLLVTFLRKYYTESACTPSYSVNKYLDSLDNAKRRKLLKDIIKELDYNISNDDKWAGLKDIFDKIFTQIFPDYSIIIKVEEGTDIDIDDEDIIHDIENDYKNPNLIDYIRDFDNKIWQVDTKSPGDDKTTDVFIPDKYLDYVIFYNPNIENTAE